MVEDPSPHMGTQAPSPGGPEGSPTSLFVYVEDVDAVIERAVELGATLKRAPQDRFYGDRDGAIVDPFGHAWTIATHVEDVAPEEMMRRMAALYEEA
jgi:PhnB protein